jgi:hypothetical protein
VCNSNEGGAALYRGLTPAILRQALCGGIGVGFYAPVYNRDSVVAQL